MTLLALGRTLGLLLVARGAALVESVLDARSALVLAVTLETALDLFLGFGRVMALEAVRTINVIGMIKGNTGFLVHPLVNGYLGRGIPGNSH